MIAWHWRNQITALILISTRGCLRMQRAIVHNTLALCYCTDKNSEARRNSLLNVVNNEITGTLWRKRIQIF
ncbi:hypothetical protein F5887DRAFT_978950 [Amanita rubescens]|nr:hypothetical protein F5887DRAFT_978950 [Amanita rubescens]